MKTQDFYDDTCRCAHWFVHHKSFFKKDCTPDCKFCECLHFEKATPTSSAQDPK